MLDWLAMARVRLLTADDARLVFDLRLLSLATDSDAFLATEEEDRARGLMWFSDRLSDHLSDPVCCVFGAQQDDQLVGLVGAFRGERLRARHKATIWGMWVEPSQRRQGIARRLMKEILSHLRIHGVELVQLSVASGQAAARDLYSSLGFVSYGIEKGAMKVGDRYIDEEHMSLWLV